MSGGWGFELGRPGVFRGSRHTGSTLQFEFVLGLNVGATNLIGSDSEPLLNPVKPSTTRRLKDGTGKRRDRMSDKTMNRRSMMKASGVTVAATALAGCTSMGPLGGDSGGELEEIESVVSQYDGDPQAAVDDGFVIRGPYAAGAGYTFTHPERRDSHTSVEEVTLSEPSFLTFDTNGALGAAGYHGLTEELGQSPDLLADEDIDGGTERWSDHEPGTHFWAAPGGEVDVEVADLLETSNWAAVHPPDRELSVGDSMDVEWADGTEEERVVDHVVQHPHINSLFVWVGTENPEGLFAPSNPDFAQE